MQRRIVPAMKPSKPNVYKPMRFGKGLQPGTVETVEWESNQRDRVLVESLLTRVDRMPILVLCTESTLCRSTITERIRQQKLV
jgi:hypothetical protein